MPKSLAGKSPSSRVARRTWRGHRHALRQASAKVVLSGLSAADDKTLARKLGRNAVFEQTDLTRVEDCERLIRVALDRFKKIDI
jgi:NADP-dependent 3-hydroxy acid dehydrogenase YdfG